MKRLIFALGSMSLVGLFSACGQSGPLYLPGDPSKLETVVPAPTTDEEDDDKEEESDEG